MHIEPGSGTHILTLRAASLFADDPRTRATLSDEPEPGFPQELEAVSRARLRAQAVRALDRLRRA